MASIVLSNRELLAIRAGLSELVKMEFPSVFGFKVRRLNRAIEPLVELYQEQERETMKRYYKRDEDGNEVHPLGEDGEPDENRVVLENVQELTAELDALRDVTSAIEVELLTEKDFDGHNIQPRILIALDKVIE